MTTASAEVRRIIDRGDHEAEIGISCWDLREWAELADTWMSTADLARTLRETWHMSSTQIQRAGELLAERAAYGQHHAAAYGLKLLACSAAAVPSPVHRHDGDGAAAAPGSSR